MRFYRVAQGLATFVRVVLASICTVSAVIYMAVVAHSIVWLPHK